MTDTKIDQALEQQKKADVESAILACLILDHTLVERALDRLPLESFALPAHQVVYQGILSLWKQSKSLDLVSLKDFLSKDQLKDIGGPSYLATIVKNLPENPAYEAYEKILLDEYEKRQYGTLAKAILTEVESDGDVESLRNRVSTLSRVATYSNEPLSTVGTIAEAAISGIDRTRKEGVDLHFGVKELDDVLGGVRRKTLYTIGGRTSQGKTTVCCNWILHNLTLSKTCKILYNGFENIDQVPIRLASLQSGIRLDNYLKPDRLTNEEYGNIIISLGDLSQYNDRLLILGGYGRAKLRSAVREFRPDIIMVDYLQRYAERDAPYGGDNHRLTVSRAVSDLQDIALEFNSAMFCYSQFKRASDEYKGKPPTIEDLKESGDIENYSDNIILLWWPWRDTLDDKKYRPNDYRFLIRKNKLGPIMDIPAYVNLETLRVA